MPGCPNCGSKFSNFIFADAGSVSYDCTACLHFWQETAPAKGDEEEKEDE